ncbi:MAG: TonB family protein, partial [Clostridia bacterium]|nr:TonB family protein [Deltaproteobacteria bacterium]
MRLFLGLAQLFGRLFIVSCGLWYAPQLALAQIESQNVPDTPPPPKPAPKLTKAPELVTYVSPDYPEALFAQGTSGDAVVVIEIGPTGAVNDVTLQSASDPAFGDPALAAAKKLVFTPAEVDDVPSAIRIEYRFVFEPQSADPDVITGAPEAALADMGPVNFRGRVLYAVSRAPFEGATVLIAGRPAAVTNDDGRFEIRGAPDGQFQVRIVGQGRQPYIIEEQRTATELLEAKYYLLPLDNDPYQTVVSARGPKREVSKIELSRAEVEKVPGTFGDPLRVIENLPGMGRAFGGLGGQLIVRGANPEDTKVYVDGVEVPFLYHFGGLTSILQSQFLDHIDFYPGGFGAKYGRSTAGIVDVGTRVLDCNAVHGAAKVDFIDSAAYVCAPLGGGWSLAGAARRSYIDLLLPLVLDN